MAAIAELALAGDRLDLVEHFGDAGFTIAELQFTHTGAVEQQTTTGQEMKGAGGGRMTALFVDIADFTGCLHVVADQGIDDGRFADPGGADQGNGLPRLTPAAQPVDRLRILRVDGFDEQPGTQRNRRGGELFNAVAQIDLGQHQDRLHPGIERQGQVSFNA